MALNLTFGRRFVLQQIAAGDKTGSAISVIAMRKGYNKRDSARLEWADGFIRALREVGYIEDTGQTEHRCTVYRVTDAGRKALES